ncbi:uncharacterized protein LOC143301101 isoform X2 [Babylonia areolata]|uniref:uncharacterized protein LOC143301101 isoform X2 n=1 Tax=Babylonia areolata TaxID=304850 RepID=UPI003FD152D9
MDKVVVTVIWFLCASTSWVLPSDSFTTSRPLCFRGWTGPDSGGSCSFSTETMCDWTTVDGDDLTWKLHGRDEVLLSPSWYTGPERGRLRSPPLCEEAGRRACLEVRFRFGDGGGSRLYAELCGHQATCTQLFQHVYDDNEEWTVTAVPFLTVGLFEIFIVGEKYENTYGGESDIFIDYIRYNSTSCAEEAARVTTPDITDADNLTPVTGGDVTPETTGQNEQGELEAEKEEKGDDDDDEEDSLGVIIIGVSSALVLIMIIAVLITTVVVVRRRRSAAHRKEATLQGSARNNRDDSVVMVTNEMYACMGEVPSMRFEEVENTREETRQSSPSTAATSVTPSQRTSRSSDAYYSSMKRPVSSPPRVTSDDNDDDDDDDHNHYDAAEDTTFLGASAFPQNNDINEEVDVYENTDKTKVADDDDQGLYENTDKSGSGAEEDMSVYENTTSRDLEPATATAIVGGGADDEKMAAADTTEYSHLIDDNKRPERRLATYDHLDD